MLPTSWFADLPTFLTFLQSVAVVYSQPSPYLVSPVACLDSAEELVDYGQGQQSELPRNAAAAKKKINSFNNSFPRKCGEECKTSNCADMTVSMMCEWQCH